MDKINFFFLNIGNKTTGKVIHYNVIFRFIKNNGNRNMKSLQNGITL